MIRMPFIQKKMTILIWDRTMNSQILSGNPQNRIFHAPEQRRAAAGVWADCSKSLYLWE